MNEKLLMMAFSQPLKTILQGLTNGDINDYSECMMKLFYYVKYVKENLQPDDSLADKTIDFTQVDPSIYDLLR